MLLIRGFNYLFTLRYISLFLFVDFFCFPLRLLLPLWIYIIARPLSFSFRSLSLSLYSFAQNDSSFAVAFARGYSKHYLFLFVLEQMRFFFVEYSLLFDFECVLICVVYACVEMCVSLSLSFMAAWYYYTGEAWSQKKECN